MDFEELLYQRIRSEIDKWDKNDIYALYFGVHTNGADGNIPHFYIGCGKEGSTGVSGGKWHLAVFCENETEITEDKAVADALTEWLHGQGIDNIGYEDKNEMYDEMMMYIGKGPAGAYELLQLGVKIAKRFFEEGYIEKTFGKDIPVIFDDLETTWYCIEATENANPPGLAGDFLRKYSYNRKNSPAARTLAGAAMGAVGLFRIIAILPNSLFMMLVTLAAGGIHFPLTGGGIAKLVLFGLSVLSDILKKAQMGLSEAKKVALCGLFLAADLLLSCLVSMSCAFMPDRIAALVMLVFVIIFCAVDGAVMKKARNELMNERGDEVAKMFADLRKENAERRDKNDNDKDD